MRPTEPLTQKQQHTLWLLYWDDAVQTVEGLIFVDNNERIDLRSATSLVKRGLAEWYPDYRTGAHLVGGNFRCTAQGEKLVEQWEEQGYDPTK